METYTYSDIAQDLASFSKLSHELDITIENLLAYKKQLG